MMCTPEPDAFNPCEDVMGNPILTFSAILVAVLSLVGNLTVIIVLVASRFGFTVSTFLMCNLAVADFFMGVYMAMITWKDITTTGSYFNHAIDWQEGNLVQ